MAVAVELQAEYRLPPALEVIRGNIVKYGMPLALKGTEIAGWAKGLSLPQQGEVLLYTGGEYQLVPFIDSLVQTMTRLDQGSKGFSLVMGMRNFLDRAGISAEKLYASVLAKERERFNLVSYKAAMVLQGLGLKLCYLGEQEVYSGALLYELGYWEDLRHHAKKVAQLIGQTGAKTIVCLSPHSAEVFKLVYPQLVEGFDVEVKTFVEVVWELVKDAPERLHIPYSGSVTIHDSCRLARELGITEEIREIFGLIGIEVLEPEKNRRWTSCCGGPNKILFPEISGLVGCRRAEELAETGADLAVTFCPYCMASLDKGIKETGKKLVMEDFIEFLFRGVGR